MSTPDTSSSNEDYSLFHKVIQRARTPDTAGVFNSYHYVTTSAFSRSSQSDDSQSSTASQTADSKESSSLSGNLALGASGTSSEDGPTPVSSVPSRIWSPRFGRARRTVHPLGETDSGTKIRVVKADDAGASQPTTREVWGWFLCEIGMSGFRALLWIFFPLLIFSLFAVSRSFRGGTSTGADTVHCQYGVQDRDPRCLIVCDSFTKTLTRWTSGSLGSNQTRSSGVTILEILSARSWQPAELITGMLGASVLLQFLLFTITSPLLDYGRYQNYLLWLGTGMGVVATAITTINIFRASAWWIGGILFLFSSISVGLVSTWLEWYLSSLARGIPILKTHLFGKVQIFQSVRTRFVNKVSLAGVTFGSWSAVFCTVAAFFFLRSRLVPQALGVNPNNEPLRIACCIAGLWWLFWTVVSSAFLLRGRPGPKLQSMPHPVGEHLPRAILEMRMRAGMGRSALLLLLVCFLSSMGNATVFQSALLCFSPRNFVKLVLLSHLSSLAGTLFFSVIQIALAWSNKAMLLTALLLQLLLPLYACVGFFFTTSRTKSKVLGLNHEWEFLVFAGAYGVCLGAHRSYIRTLFLACIPRPTSVGAYYSLLTLVNQFSTFVGSLEVLLLVHNNRDLRFTFVIMGVALFLASIFMVTYTSTSISDDIDLVADTDESLYHDAGLIESYNVSTSNSPVDVPMSLRAEFTSNRGITEDGRIQPRLPGTYDELMTATGHT